MKGLELSRRFFSDWGLPYLKSNHPDFVNRVAAGLIGSSQSIGADDELSQDHGWGPYFTLWLTDEDFTAMGESLKKKMNEDALKIFAGFTLAKNTQSVYVNSIDQFFEEETGHRHPPQGTGNWQIGGNIESHLYFIKHRTIFHDPLGEFTARCQEFSQWPQEAYLQRIRGCLFDLWHHGEYNFIKRVSKRDDPIARLTCLGHFASAALKLCFYLNDDFSPYWKWLSHEIRKIDWAETIWREIDALATTTDIELQVSHVDTICRLLRKELTAKGLISSEDAPDMGRHEIIEKINKLQKSAG